MKDYREIYCEAVNRLWETRDTSAHAAAEENYYKVFEEMATNGGCIVEIVKDGLDEVFCEREFYHFEAPEWDKTMDDFAKEIEILRRVSYPWVEEWEQAYKEYADWRAAHAA